MAGRVFRRGSNGALTNITLTRRQATGALSPISVLSGGKNLYDSSTGPNTPVTPPPVVDKVDGWKLIGPHGGGWVTGIDLCPDGTQYCRTDVGGGYRRDPGGIWQQLCKTTSLPNGGDVPSSNIDALVGAPSNSQICYITMGNDLNNAIGRFMRSTNGGRTWTEPRPDLRWFVDGNMAWRPARMPMAIDHQNPDSVWWGTPKNGLWHTSNGGGNLAQVGSLPAADSNGADPAGVSVVMLDPTSAFANGRRQTVWAGVQGRGIYRSTDGGNSWQQIVALTTSAVTHAQRHPNGQMFFVVWGYSGQPHRVLRINADGSGVTNINPPDGSPRRAIAVSPTNPNLIYVNNDGMFGNYAGIWRSTNGGQSWTAMRYAITNGSDGEIWPTQSAMGTEWLSCSNMVFNDAGTTVYFAEGMGVWKFSPSTTNSEVVLDFDSFGIQELVAQSIVKPKGIANGAIGVGWDRGVYGWDEQDRAILPYYGGFCSAWDVQVQPGTDGRVVVAQVSQHLGDADTSYGSDRRLSAISENYGKPGSWRRLAGLANGSTPIGLRFGSIAIARGDINNLVWAPEPHGDLPGPQLRYSRDRGATWQTPNVAGWPTTDSFKRRIQGPRYLKQRKIVPSPWDNGHFFATAAARWDAPDASATYFMRSTNGGQDWTSVNIGGQVGGWFMEYNAWVVPVPHQPGRIILCPGPRGGGFNDNEQVNPWQSFDYGQTWSAMTNIKGMHELSFGAPAPGTTTPTWWTFGFVNGERGFWASTDNGVTWRKTTPFGNPDNWNIVVAGIAADPDVFGRLWIGAGIASFFKGDLTVAGIQSTPGGTGSTVAALTYPQNDSATWPAGYQERGYGDAGNVGSIEWRQSLGKALVRVVKPTEAANRVETQFYPFPSPVSGAKTVDIVITGLRLPSGYNGTQAWMNFGLSKDVNMEADSLAKMILWRTSPDGTRIIQRINNTVASTPNLRDAQNNLVFPPGGVDLTVRIRVSPSTNKVFVRWWQGGTEPTSWNIESSATGADNSNPVQQVPFFAEPDWDTLEGAGFMFSTSSATGTYDFSFTSVTFTAA